MGGRQGLNGARRFVALSDQTRPGCAQTHLLRGGHIAMEEFFKWQLASFGRLGSLSCEGWSLPEDTHFRRRPSTEIPSLVKRYFAQSEETSLRAGCEREGGERVPLPTPLLLRPGDTAISTYHMPHAGSPNDRGADRQQMVAIRWRCHDAASRSDLSTKSKIAG